MRAYIIRRLLLVIPTVFLVSLIVFFVIRLIPGDIIDALVAELGFRGMDRAAVMAAMGLDVPILTQYGRWLGVLRGADGSFSGIFQGDLGDS